MIDECRDSIPIYDVLAIQQPKQVSAIGVLIEIISFLVSQSRPCIFGDNCPPFNWSGRIDSVGVNFRSADHETHHIEISIRSGDAMSAATQ